MPTKRPKVIGFSGYEAGNHTCPGGSGCGIMKDEPLNRRFCEGSTCMAWRSLPSGYGFCGLAGIPMTYPTPKSR